MDNKTLNIYIGFTGFEAAIAHFFNRGTIQMTSEWGDEKIGLETASPPRRLRKLAEWRSCVSLVWVLPAESGRERSRVEWDELDDKLWAMGALRSARDVREGRDAAGQRTHFWLSGGTAGAVH